MLDKPMEIQSALDLANMTRSTEEVTERLNMILEKRQVPTRPKQGDEEMAETEFDSVLPMMQLAAIVPATFRAWQTVRNRLLVLACVLLVVSFFLSPYLVFVDVFILLLLARYLGLHGRAYSDALSAFLPIVKIIVRWIHGDPDGCRKWCTENCPRFSTVFGVVSSDDTVKRYIAGNSKAHM